MEEKFFYKNKNEFNLIKTSKQVVLMSKETKVTRSALKVYELPHDILYKICNFSNVIDICYLQNTNKIIKSKLKRIGNDILSYQLQLRNNTHYKNKIHFLGEPCFNESNQGTLRNFDSLKKGTNSFIINDPLFKCWYSLNKCNQFSNFCIENTNSGSNSFINGFVKYCKY